MSFTHSREHRLKAPGGFRAAGPLCRGGLFPTGTAHRIHQLPLHGDVFNPPPVFNPRQHGNGSALAPQTGAQVGNGSRGFRLPTPVDLTR